MSQKSNTEQLAKVSYEDAVAASKKYFQGDELAAQVWVSKYALKDSFGNIYETTPVDMHNRIAKELARIENNYPNPLALYYAHPSLYIYLENWINLLE